MKPLAVIYFLLCFLLMLVEYRGDSTIAMIAYYGFVGINFYKSSRLINKQYKIK